MTDDHTAPDSVNMVYLLGETSLELEGPFSFLVDGWQYEVTFPLSEDDYGALSEVEERLVKDREDDMVLFIADGERVGYGEVKTIDEIEDRMILAAKVAGAPEGV